MATSGIPSSGPSHHQAPGGESPPSSLPGSRPIFDTAQLAFTAEPDDHTPEVARGTLQLNLLDSWSEQNLLSLDGGGIRGYWTLLVLQRLMELVGQEELEYINPRTGHQETAIHSFWPGPFPDNVTHGPFSDDQREAMQQANGNRVAICRALENSQKFLPCHYFDYICGSSTGGLIAIMLGRFRMPVFDCLHEYETMGHQIFGKPRIVSQRNIGIVRWPKYNAKHMEQAFRDVTRRRRELLLTSNRIKDVTFPSDEALCKTFVTAFNSKRTKGSPGSQSKLYLIRTYDTLQNLPPTERRRHTTYSSTRSYRERTSAGRWQQRNPGPADKFEIWEVARAATAAPMYFEPMKFNDHGNPASKYYFSDGGFGHTNNPSQEGLNEIQVRHGLQHVGVVVSVGTARGEAEEGRSVFKRVKKFVDTATDPATVARFMDDHSRAAGEGFEYFRINDDNGLVGVGLDDWRPNSIFSKRPGRKTLRKIKTQFNEWANDLGNHRYLHDCARELVGRRRARLGDTARWERFSTGAKFTCRYSGCGSTTFQSSGQLRDHIRTLHADPNESLDERVESMTEPWRYQPSQNG